MVTGLVWSSEEVTFIGDIRDSSPDIGELQASSPDPVGWGLSKQTDTVWLELLDGPPGVFVERARECVLSFSMTTHWNTV